MKIRTIQKHHISYKPEIVVYVYKGEHHILTFLQWRKYFSKGFFDSLDDFILKHRCEAVDLEPMYAIQTKIRKKTKKVRRVGE